MGRASDHESELHDNLSGNVRYSIIHTEGERVYNTSYKAYKSHTTMFPNDKEIGTGALAESAQKDYE